MCKCNPSIRTPFCGRGDCNWPSNKEGVRDANSTKTWQEEYPLNTFTGETKKELIKFITDIRKKDEEELLKRIEDGDGDNFYWIVKQYYEE